MFPWLLNMYVDAGMNEVKMARIGVRYLVNGREWKLLGFLYADDLVM